MDRPDLEIFKENLRAWPEPGLGKEKALEVINYALDLEKRYSRLAQLNDDQYEQYLIVLNERDELQEQLDRRESDLSVLGYCLHGVNLDIDFCQFGCRI